MSLALIRRIASPKKALTVTAVAAATTGMALAAAPAQAASTSASSAQAIALPDTQARLKAMGNDPVASTPEEFDAKVRADATNSCIQRSPNGTG